jgi:hypothetical protein
VLDVAAHAGDGAAGAHAGHEDVDGTAGVFPDLGAGGGFVDGRVGRVLELLQQHVLGVAGGNSSALAMAPFMPLAPSVSTSLAP